MRRDEIAMQGRGELEAHYVTSVIVVSIRVKIKPPSRTPVRQIHAEFHGHLDFSKSILSLGLVLLVPAVRSQVFRNSLVTKE
jgi:hypothetical protein